MQYARFLIPMSILRIRVRGAGFGRVVDISAARRAESSGLVPEERSPHLEAIAFRSLRRRVLGTLRAIHHFMVLGGKMGRDITSMVFGGRDDASEAEKRG